MDCVQVRGHVLELLFDGEGVLGLRLGCAVENMFGSGKERHAEREVLLYAGDVAHVEDFSLVRWFRADWVPDSVCEGVLGRVWGVVRWEVAAGDERPACCGGKGSLAPVDDAETAVSASGRAAAGGRVGGRAVDGCEVEKEEARVDLPEAATTNKHLRPGAGLLGLNWLVADKGLLAGDQAHAFELLEQVPALEDAVALDVDAPVAFGSAAGRGFGRGLGVELEIGLGLVEVPIEGDPDHHGDLPGGRAGGLVLRTGRVDNGGDVEAVLVQGRSDEARAPRIRVAILA